MKKLYRKGTVHPTPPVVSNHLLSFLPAAILTLTVALSPEDKEVLAYLISCFSANFSNNHRKAAVKTPATAKISADHPSCFDCNCFRCYMCYWVKWDSSPNRQLIHEIIDAFEDTLLKENKNKNKNKKENKKDKKKKGKIVKADNSLELDESKNFGFEMVSNKEDLSFVGAEVVGDDEVEEKVNVDEEEFEKGSVRRFVSFVGERIWSVWG